MTIAGRQQVSTPKELVVAIAPNSSHYHVYFKTGGQLPPELSGVWNKRNLAERAVAAWQADKQKVMEAK